MSDEHPEFTEAVLVSCRRCATDVGYLPEYSIELINEHFGVGALKFLLGQLKPPTDFMRLCDKGRLDLSMEALILESDVWIKLFTDAELMVAYKRLASHGYKPRAKAAPNAGDGQSAVNAASA